MTTESFHSQAFNFTDALKGQVDPRTGLFTFVLPLGSLLGNDGLGPGVDLTLRYSPISTEDQGWGKGVTLDVTRVDTRASTLTLASGECNPLVPGTTVVRHAKMDHFRLQPLSGGQGYRVVHADGRIETLGHWAADIYLTSHIASPLGWGLHLDWTAAGGPRLSSIRDDRDTELCRCQYQGQSHARIVFYPGTEAEYTCELTLESGHLKSINVQGSEVLPLRWQWHYDWADPARTFWSLVGVDHPMGAQEKVTYDLTEGMRFPNQAGAIPALPRVSEHRLIPGAGQPDMVSHYRYTANNYLGRHGLFGAWAKDADYLYGALTDYVYGSTQTTFNPDGTSVETERQWNNYHLLIQEQVRQQGAYREQIIAYHARPGVHFEDQPAQCLQPLTTTRRWRHDTRMREEAETTHFDAHGLLSQRIAIDGTVIDYSYYPPDGEDGCPADPHGFIRRLKQQQIRPPTVAGYDDIPVRTVVHHYDTLAARPGHPVAHAVVPTARHHRADGVLLRSETLVYGSAGDENDGRVISHREDFWHEDTLVNRQERLFDTSCEGDERVVGQVSWLDDGKDRQASDAIRLVTQSRHCRYTDRVLAERDEGGFLTRYAYDRLGRLTQRVAHADQDDYRFQDTWHYDAGGGTGRAGIVHTDRCGNRTCRKVDGLGREIAVYIEERDRGVQAHGVDWVKRAEQHYDTRGFVHRTASFDIFHADDGTKDYVCVGEQALHRDAWDAVTAVHRHDGVVEHTVTDPIAQTVTQWRTDTPGACRTGSTVIQLDIAQRPRLTSRFTCDGALDAVVRHVWDGAGRCRQRVDAQGHATAYDYDVHGRTARVTHPDGLIEHRRYTTWSEEPWLLELAVTDTQGVYRSLGEQTFTRAGHLNSRTDGGRTRGLDYDAPWHSQPRHTEEPDGTVIDYACDDALGEVITHMKARRHTDAASATFDYDTRRAQLQAATNAEASLRWRYHPSGRLREYEVTLTGDAPRHTHFTYSLAGLPETVTGPHEGPRTYHYGTSGPDAGRLVRLTQSQASVDLHYDSLARRDGMTVHDHATGQSMTVTLTYDDFGREIGRRMTATEGHTLDLTQTWTSCDQVDGKKRAEAGRTVCAETFRYDARHRLQHYHAVGEQLPVDGQGHAILAETYEVDALGNLDRCLTQYADGTRDETTYGYENRADPFQPSVIRHTGVGNRDGSPAEVRLQYDHAGRLQGEGRDVTRHYDLWGRMTQVGRTAPMAFYHYDALGRLVWQQDVGRQEHHRFFYEGDTPACMHSAIGDDVSAQTMTWLRVAGCPVLELTRDGVTRLATDGHGSIMAAWTSGRDDRFIYGPFGIRGTAQRGTVDHPMTRALGFNGQRQDPVTTDYLLGNGYRAYMPALRAFNAPDSLSPLGPAGLSPYAYCHGDPVNRLDPSGHMSWQAGLSIGLGILGILGAVFTAGASIAASTSMSAAMLATTVASAVTGVTSEALGIASAVTKDEDTAAKLGWAGLGLGLASGMMGIGISASMGATRSGRLILANAARRVRSRPSAMRPHGLAMGEIEDFYSHATPIAMNNRPIQTPAKRGDVWMLELDPKNASGYRMRNVDLDTIRIPDGKYDYVIPFRHPDRIALMPTRTGGRGFGMGHTSMTQTTPGHADDVLYAGDISFDRGTLTQWSNQSGHYLPDTDLIDSNLTPTVKQLLPMSKFTARE